MARFHKQTAARQVHLNRCLENIIRPVAGPMQTKRERTHIGVMHWLHIDKSVVDGSAAGIFAHVHFIGGASMLACLLATGCSLPLVVPCAPEEVLE